MDPSLPFDALLPLIEERSVAFRAAAQAAPDLDATVPSCPEWTLFDLVQHLGRSHRRWADTVAAGPAEAPPASAAPDVAPVAPREREALLAWSAEATRLLLAALRDAGPDVGCWTWWDRSLSPQTGGAVARHELQHVAVHTWDAQLTAGDPQPLPAEVALDGVEEFLSTSCAGAYRWPHEPADVDYVADEGRGWRLSLTAPGAGLTRLDATSAAPPAGATARGTAGEVVLFLYGRVPVTALAVEGDPHLFDLLAEWDPDAS